MSAVMGWLIPLAVGTATGVLSGFGVGGGTLLLVYLTAVAGADQKQREAAVEYAACVGLAFQIRDDILDVISDPETLGKPVGSDDKNEKSTYVSLLGMEKAQQLVNELTQQAESALSAFSEDTAFLREFAQSLANRGY